MEGIRLSNWKARTNVGLQGQGLGETQEGGAVLNRTKGFRNVFAVVVAADPSILDTFLNTLFNVLNSTVSEFFVMKLDVCHTIALPIFLI